MIPRVRHAVRLSLLAGIAFACTAPAITDATNAADPAVRRNTVAPPNLVQCPANGTSSATATIGALGGLVSVNGTSISIPAGALLSPAQVTVTVPASNLMEIDISVSGSEHFVFQQPVVVTLSYARCNRSDIDAAPLTVWYIDTVTKEPLELMGGIDNKLLRTVTFTTLHLSGYAIAN